MIIPVGVDAKLIEQAKIARFNIAVDLVKILFGNPAAISEIGATGLAEMALTATDKLINEAMLGVDKPSLVQ